MQWWDSTEVLSKIGMWVSGLIIFLGIVGLTVKVRGDHLSSAKNRAEQSERKKQASLWNQQIVEARENAADAERKAADAEKKVLPRKIDPSVRTALVADLGAGEKGQVVVLSDWTDSESKNYARAITSILQEAGFSVIEIWPEVLSLNWHDEAGPRPQVIIFAMELEKPRPFAVSIQKCFLAHGIPNVAQRADGNITKGIKRARDAATGPWELDSDTAVLWVMSR